MSVQASSGPAAGIVHELYRAGRRALDAQWAHGRNQEGRAVSSYGQYCPVARAAEILGDRWTVLVIRDLLTGARHFNDLARGLPRMSRSLLSKRLKKLERAGVVERRQQGCEGRPAYVMTPAGTALWPVLDSLMTWGAQWAFDQPDEQELDPVLLMWWIRRGTVPERMPHQRVTVEFRFEDDEHGRYWLLVVNDDVSVCMDPPPFDVDVWVETDMRSLYRVWLGRIDYRDALARGLLDVHGTPALERSFPRWFDWSPAFPAVREAWAPSG